MQLDQSTMSRHQNPEDCERFLQEENALTPESSKIIVTYLRISERGLDEFLRLFPNSIRNDDNLHNILLYMRAHHILTRMITREYSNNCLFTNVERKVTELLAVVEQKDRHAFWFLAHSLKTKNRALYEFLHGPIQCCVCKEIKQKEMEEKLHFSDLPSDVTVLSVLKKALKEAIEEKCLIARTAVKNFADKRGRKIYTTISEETCTGEAADTETGDEDYNNDAEGLPLKNLPNETDEAKRVKNDVINPTKDLVPVSAEQQLCTVTRRKRAYKAAFVALSAVTLFTFHPLPAFDFLFLFIYCNFLIILITF
ncbi:hypothetical protein OS493_026229 [Desmophyllum pertusum]|uniref:Uncharacterized protein n=1 Tax=Desmophyllum pertusum TaxID=174260 RepID=A0A9X0D3Q0_9CNID|nr:hypothetical protein OS493_026229 [Desmophyllum pertusum]